jgi:hypothetical protein
LGNIETPTPGTASAVSFHARLAIYGLGLVIKALKDRTLGNWTAARALSCQLYERLLHRGQSFDLLIDVSDFRFGASADLVTLRSGLDLQREQFSNLRQRES